MILYHYTCHHLADQIREAGVIRPQPQPLLAGMPVVWLGDFRMRSQHLNRLLGLGWHTNRPSCAGQKYPCDPAGDRFPVDVPTTDHPFVYPFARIAVEFPEAAAHYRRLPGAKTWRWWYATRPVRLNRRLTPIVKRGNP